MATPPRDVDTHSYHLWTDALHARSLAKETHNPWDRGAYVRWAIIAAWTAFETASGEVLGVDRFASSFKESVDTAILDLRLPRIVWGSGIWQRVREVLQQRNDYTHHRLPHERLFPGVQEAEDAIRYLREALSDLHVRAGKNAPAWIEADSAPGWSGKVGGSSSKANATVVRAGADELDPDTIRIKYVYQEREFASEVLPAGTDPEPVMRELMERVEIPISAVRSYRGSTLVNEILTPHFRY